jgi:hypothetical protein
MSIHRVLGKVDAALDGLLVVGHHTDLHGVEKLVRITDGVVIALVPIYHLWCGEALGDEGLPHVVDDSMVAPQDPSETGLDFHRNPAKDDINGFGELGAIPGDLVPILFENTVGSILIDQS